MFRKTTTALILSLAAPLAAAEPVKMCVFDVIGANGDMYNMVKDYALEMKAHGVDFELRPYTDEGVAVGDFNSGQCDAVAATDLRTRPFNRFTGSISAVGAIPTYDDLKTVLATLAQPKAAKLMKQGDYEVLGIVPAGAGYLFVNDRSIDTAGELAGKRMATLDYQKDAIHMVNHVKATVVPSDITNFAGKFNNGSVDTAYAPAFAYEALELYKGVGDTGGIVDYPLAQLTIQIIAKDDVLSDEVAQKSREVAWGMYGQAMDLILKNEKNIPQEKWVKISEADIGGYQEMFRENRLQLRDGTDGASKVYDPRMMSLLSKVRCASNPGASECTAANRE
ncbi:MAG: putative solute-binding protein [Marinobacter sp.]|uniref:putative solute-binding protein n=1 Tax=Marinobacter sp. TaxID=50741 RepID=UPI00299F3CDD|nr:putative solute-binding protein [Marinobacter sp.]MDX1635264.1 putative solute-binding protein [Marinobacter sp.]